MKPACTLVVAYGDSMPWKILRASRLGVRFSDFCGAEEERPILGGPLPLALGEEVER